MINVVAISEDVKAKTEARINELKAEIQQTLTDITTIVEENKSLITQAPKGKGGSTVLMAIKAEIATIETSAAEVQAAVGTESFIATLDKAKAVKEQASNINNELKAVIEKYTKK